MKIITVNINKGGTGKSTISYNLAKYISEKKDQKVLLVDGDRSCNLSYSFDNLGKSTIVDIFDRKPLEIYPVSKNLGFIKGSELLEDHSLDLKSKQNNCMIMYMWISDNYKRIEDYDYMIIDTHNDDSLVTSNFLAVADIVLGVSEPSRNGLRAWLELEDTINYLKSELIELKTRETYVNAEPYLLGNRVDHIGNSSKDFLEVAEKQNNFIGIIQKKEMLAKSLIDDISIFERENKMSVKEKEKHESFFNNISSVFDTILEKADRT
ncbi:ParA family protein [Alkalibacterium sp. 20]|uniref:ParA family protein n=1 Tax=Alkalibacterium sp. 20 TaxID=1798803 RepID=UPI0009002CCD|nr:ParA family protein [Alkalibacterium sp. 20]OJF96195.1 cobalamin biosynthesis protein CobQ [Alkalibacterium sp. 20]